LANFYQEESFWLDGYAAFMTIKEDYEERVNKVEDVVKVGDTLKVKVIKIDEKGRVDATAHF